MKTAEEYIAEAKVSPSNYLHVDATKELHLVEVFDLLVALEQSTLDFGGHVSQQVMVGRVAHIYRGPGWQVRVSTGKLYSYWNSKLIVTNLQFVSYLDHG